MKLFVYFLQKKAGEIKEKMKTAKEKIPHIEIKATPGFAHVFIDGTEIHGVRGFSLTADVNRDSSDEHRVQFSMVLNADDVSVDALLLPALPDAYRQWYKPNINYPTPEESRNYDKYGIKEDQI